MSQWLSDAKYSSVLVNLEHVVAIERREIPGVKGQASTFSLIATVTNGKEIVVESGLTKETIGAKIRNIKAVIEGSLKPVQEALEKKIADAGKKATK